MHPSLHNLVGAGARGRPRENPYALSSDAFASLNETGGVAMTLSSTVDFEGMIRRMDEGTSRWFYAMVDAARNDPLEKPGVGFFAEALRQQKPLFDALGRDVQQWMLAHFDPRTEAGRYTLTDASRRQIVANEVATRYGCEHYLLYLVAHAKQGNASMALSKIQQAWTDTGFGLWANLVPEEGLLACMDVARMLSQQLSLQSQMHSHFPHVIHKPYNSSLLKTHHDQMLSLELMDKLRRHVQSADPSTYAWVRANGMQMLAHVVGGRHTEAEESGATYIIGPMTPARLLLVLTELYENQAAYGIAADFWTRDGGPYFLPYEKHLPALNEMLKRKEGPTAPTLQRIPLQTNNQADRTNPTNQTTQAMVIGWPVGWLHGSFASTRARRVTLTVPLDVKVGVPVDQAKQLDALQWLDDLATISSTQFDTPTERSDLVAAHHRIVTRRVPFADGSTHRMPSIAASLMRSREAASILGTLPGWFFDIGPKRDSVARMRHMFLQQASSSGAGSSSDSMHEHPIHNHLMHNPQDPADLEVHDHHQMHEEGRLSTRPWPTIVPSLIYPDATQPPVAPAMPLYELYGRMEGGRSQTTTPMTTQMTIQPPYPALALYKQQVAHSLAELPNLRCLNVRQPWASMLAEGIKSVENRPLGANKPYFERQVPFDATKTGEWVLIVASTAKPTQAVLTLALQDFQKCYGAERGRQNYDAFMSRHNGRWPLGSIVGAVRFDHLITPEMAQAVATRTMAPPPWLYGCDLQWYHGGADVGWHVANGETIVLNSPITGISGVLSIARIASKGGEVESRIRDALRRL